MGDYSLVKRDGERVAKRVGVAYLLWFAGFFLIAGLHRFYVGRWASGLLWLLTGGLCGVGQIVDLFFLPGMVMDQEQGKSVW